MVILKTLVDVVDGPYGQQRLLDTISWKGKLWLVPRWQHTKTEGIRQPVRIVRPHLFHFVQPKFPQRGEDYTLNVAIPKAILDGQEASKSIVEFEVVEAPAIEIQIPNPH